MHRRPVLKIRDVGPAQAKQEILQLIQTRRTVWTSDIAIKLRLDIDVVLNALRELKAERKIRNGNS